VNPSPRGWCLLCGNMKKINNDKIMKRTNKNNITKKISQIKRSTCQNKLIQPNKSVIYNKLNKKITKKQQTNHNKSIQPIMYLWDSIFWPPPHTAPLGPDAARQTWSWNSLLCDPCLDLFSRKLVI
jgi:hypothetical protein